MVAGSRANWGCKDVETGDALSAEAASDRTRASEMAIWSVKPIGGQKLFCHHQIWSSESPRKLPSVDIVIRVHKENNLISCLLPGK